jgi:hypothetical protein
LVFTVWASTDTSCSAPLLSWPGVVLPRVQGEMATTTFGYHTRLGDKFFVFPQLAFSTILSLETQSMNASTRKCVCASIGAHSSRTTEYTIVYGAYASEAWCCFPHANQFHHARKYAASLFIFLEHLPLGQKGPSFRALKSQLFALSPFAASAPLGPSGNCH